MNALDVACPFCEAMPKQPCLDANDRVRTETHFTRQLAAANMLSMPMLTQRKLLERVFG